MEQTMQQTRQVITPSELLHHWQGHRALTRRVIEAFPEKDLFNFSIGGMRPFAALVMEFLGMGVPSLKEIVTGTMEAYNDQLDHGNKKESILQHWDKATEDINELFAQIPVERFHEDFLLFGTYKGPIWSLLYYIIDNEIHHRGQGYVYLRALGIEPPPFWDRP